MIGGVTDDSSEQIQRRCSKDAVKPRDPNRCTPVGRIKLGADPLKPAVDRLGLDVQFQPDDFAAVPSLFMPQQFDVCGGQT